MHDPTWIAVLLFAADLLIRGGLSVRVIMRRRPVGVSLAWLSVVLLIPFAGAAIYLLFGELRLGSRRAARAARIHAPYMDWLQDLRKRSSVDFSQHGEASQPLSRLIEAAVGIPPLPSNHLQLFSTWESVFDSLIEDINRAQRTCHLVFYIWHMGGRAEEVAEALIRAAERGVLCRVLVDDVGSREFLRGKLAERLRQGKVHLLAALPAGLIRNVFVRFDLRMHRKIVVIDGETAYTGSLNLVDPRFFKQDAGVGQWVDAMVRVRGPVVEALAITFLEDWELEASEGLNRLRETGNVKQLGAEGEAAIQVVPSGPASEENAIEQILLMTIYSAHRELVLTSPYFVPDESLLTALISAARRGVEVTLVVPAKVDSLMVRMASQAFKGDLLAAGVRVMLFDGGLLHTKSITVDGQISLFGSLNLDPRSLHLNFEITLTVYDQGFTSQLRALQQSYIDQSELMDLATWQSRSRVTRLTENAIRLLAPLL
jgi:cardiolipin synthase